MHPLGGADRILAGEFARAVDAEWTGDVVLAPRALAEAVVDSHAVREVDDGTPWRAAPAGDGRELRH